MMGEMEDLIRTQCASMEKDLSFFTRVYEMSSCSNLSVELFKLCVDAVNPDELELTLKSVKPKVYDVIISMLRHEAVDVDVDDETMMKIVDGVMLNPERYERKINTINMMNLNAMIEKCGLVYDNVSIGNVLDRVYHPRDILRYCDSNGTIYQFVVPQFEAMLTTGRNHYSGDPLPWFVSKKMTEYEPWSVLCGSNVLKNVIDSGAPVLDIVKGLMNERMSIDWLINNRLMPIGDICPVYSKPIVVEDDHVYVYNPTNVELMTVRCVEGWRNEEYNYGREISRAYWKYLDEKAREGLPLTIDELRVYARKQVVKKLDFDSEMCD